VNVSITRSSTALALLGITAVLVGFALVPAGRGSAQTLSGQASASPTASPSPSTSSPVANPSRSSSPSPTKSPKPGHKHKHTGTTVIGRRLYNPITNKPFKVHSSVTVSQTKNLTNQLVRVRWKGFTPSGPPGVPDIYNQALTTYPVMVAECNTVHVKYWGQCYGSNVQGLPGTGAYGPHNTAYGTTLSNGTGEVDIQVLVAEQNQFLGCGIHHRCSLVIVPAQGGYGFPVDCSNHQLDSFYALGQYDFGGLYDKCSWADRIVVPLSFVQAPKFCPIRNASFTTLGSPMLNLAMQQWVGALCAQPNPLTITYNPSITEPEAIADVASGLGDVALTTRPGPTQIGKRTYTYAPLSVSSVAIAYWVDSPKNFQPVTNLKLDPRLIAKLLTQSYNFDGDGCTVGQPPPSGIGCDAAVDGNPSTLFDDPEFKKLNPHVRAPISSIFQVPTVMSGHSDMTWEVTRWIADNQAANGFMRGQFDRWGMHVNTNYLAVHYPTDGFTGQDNFPVIAHKYSPAFPLNVVVQLQAANNDDGTAWQIDSITGNYDKDTAEFPGARSLFAIVDNADAASLQFPVAKILNDSGKYVAPTRKSMRAAVATMTPIGGNGVTRQVDFAKQKRDAYPLTMVIYAMVPTKGISKKKAAAIATFLDYVAGPGQHRGLNVGELPPGYLPLPARLVAQTQHAAGLVLAQGGNSKPKSKPTASPSSSPTSSKSPSGSSSPSPTTTPTPTPTPHIVTITLKNAQTVGMARYVLPALLILGGLAALGGASSLIASTAGTAMLAPLRRIRRPRLTLRRKP